MSIVDINDHMARVCECGCVRFNLLRSGRDFADSVENDMKTNHRPSGTMCATCAVFFG